MARRAARGGRARGRGSRRRAAARSASSSRRGRRSRLARRRVRGDAVEQRATAAQGGDGRLPARRLSRTRSGSSRARCAVLDGVSSVPATAQRARIEALARHRRVLPRAPARAVELAASARSPTARRSTRKKALAHALVGPRPRVQRARGVAARDPRRRALEIYDELGDLVSKGGVLNNLGTSAYFAGTLERGARPLPAGARGLGSSRRHAQRVDGGLQHRGDPLGAGPARRGRAAAARCRARQPARAAVRRTWPSPGWRRRSSRPVAATSTQALETLDEARRRSRSPGTRRRPPRRCARTSEVLLLGARFDAAAALADEALARAATVEGGALVLPTLHRVLGQRHLLAGPAPRPRARRSSRRSPRPSASSIATKRRLRSMGSPTGGGRPLTRAARPS